MLQSLVSVLLPSGGQLRARRNAWAAMSQDALRARAWREAELELARAAVRGDAPRPVTAAR